MFEKIAHEKIAAVEVLVVESALPFQGHAEILGLGTEIAMDESKFAVVELIGGHIVQCSRVDYAWGQRRLWSGPQTQFVVGVGAIAVARSDSDRMKSILYASVAKRGRHNRLPRKIRITQRHQKRLPGLPRRYAERVE
ncbi:MAG: hypothetical protein U9N87_14980 [Planctomycetota bacterium]|nr:hypothetical protein [Planctomycetota bacterium]